MNEQSAIVTAITTMATSVQTDALAVIGAILPIAGVIIAAIVCANLGIKLVRRWSK